MMQAAVRIFAENGYQAATIRDIVQAADVSVGTFYFYFPDKETLFVHLYEETADFLLQTLGQAINSRVSFPQQMKAAIQSYVSIAIFEPAVIQLLLVAGVGSVPSLEAKRAAFRTKMVALWERPLAAAAAKNLLAPQDIHLTAIALAGGIDEVILDLLGRAERAELAQEVTRNLVQFISRASAYLGD